MTREQDTSREIFVADDDAAVREAMSLICSAQGYRVRTFADGESLVAAARIDTPACIILDIHMPGPSGLDLLKQLNADDYPAPILIISGRGDIPMAVAAIRGGALDFIEKPFEPDAMASRVDDAIVAWQLRRDDAKSAQSDFPGRDRLTQRELEVLMQIAGGASSKEAGRRLGISYRTVEVHRAHIMDKLSAKNAADLVRIVFSEHRHH